MDTSQDDAFSILSKKKKPLMTCNLLHIDEKWWLINNFYVCVSYIFAYIVFIGCIFSVYYVYFMIKYD